MGNIPRIEKYGNNKYYGGNYYDVLRRDNYRCVNCGSERNINVHHIIGLRMNESESVDISSMVTLCRSCHSKEHYKPTSIVTDDILEKIKFNINIKNKITEIRNNFGKAKAKGVYKYGW